LEHSEDNREGQFEGAFSFKLEVFEGPLDLLLHLIRKNQLNIYDIPIALIARQYLDYLNLMKNLNLSIAGDYLVMAATLIYIKSKTLLPPDPSKFEEEELEDPRDELISRLLEYKKFKEASLFFEEKEMAWSDIFSRREDGNVEPANEELVFSDLNLFDLIDALQKVINRFPEKKILDITPETLSVTDRIHDLLEFLEQTESATFEELFSGDCSRGMVVVTFLALLEICRLRLVQIHQQEEYGLIRIKRLYTRPELEEISDGNK